VLTIADILDILLHVATTAQPLQINETTFRMNLFRRRIMLCKERKVTEKEISKTKIIHESLNKKTFKKLLTT